MQNYGDNLNPAACQLIQEFIKASRNNSNSPQDPIQVLELGCSTGFLGSQFRQQYDNLSWFGCDYNPDSLYHAKNRLNGVQFHDFNSLNLDSLALFCAKPDLIVMVDVLEHVYQPEQFLSDLVSTYPASYICCVLPNIASSQTYHKLSNHSFEYDEYGIFDKTHKTFYTVSSSIKLFSQYGMNLLQGPVFLLDPTMSQFHSETNSYPAEFSGEKFSIKVNNEFEKNSLCSYGFGLLLCPQGF